MVASIEGNSSPGKALQVSTGAQRARIATPFQLFMADGSGARQRSYLLRTVLRLSDWNQKENNETECQNVH
jgi:hypothetical protein